MALAGQLTEPEAGHDQRRIGLDVRAHHHDVTRLQRRVVFKQAEQHLPQHVDLAGRAVAGVHLNRTVRARGAAPVRPHRIGGEVGLQPAQQGAGPAAAPR